MNARVSSAFVDLAEEAVVIIDDEGIEEFCKFCI
jgi:hypothetical protein